MGQNTLKALLDKGFSKNKKWDTKNKNGTEVSRKVGQNWLKALSGKGFRGVGQLLSFRKKWDKKMGQKLDTELDSDRSTSFEIKLPCNLPAGDYS